MQTQPERVRQNVIRLCHAGLNTRTLRAEIIRQLGKVMPIDAAFFATVDPTTLLFTSAVTDDILERAAPHFLQNEFLDSDVNSFVDLARHPKHVRTLNQSTHGSLEASGRYRDILAAMSLGDELRAALIVDGACWGVMCLHREQSTASYTSADLRYVARLGPYIAEGLRTALIMSEAAGAPAPYEPGVVLLSDDLYLLASTQAADAWLEEIEIQATARRRELPPAVTAVAARLLGLETSDGASPGTMPRARVRTASGRWAVLHASRLGGAMRAGPIAVVIEEAMPADIAPILLMGYGLSRRETEIAAVVLRGLSTADIVSELHISLDTVQDHLKSIFEKSGVRSRRELVAAVFNQQYAPAMRAGMSPSSRGGFAQQQN